MPISPGTKLQQDRIVEPIGAGGMGEVYRARDERLKRDVAIKVLPSQLSGNTGFLARFEREAQAVAALSHPNILAIHDLGENGGTTYAVMELLEGETLRARLEEGPLSPHKSQNLPLSIPKGILPRVVGGL